MALCWQWSWTLDISRCDRSCEGKKNMGKFLFSRTVHPVKCNVRFQTTYHIACLLKFLLEKTELKTLKTIHFTLYPINLGDSSNYVCLLETNKKNKFILSAYFPDFKVSVTLHSRWLSQHVHKKSPFYRNFLAHQQSS